jgi:hypothetical protein
MEESPQKLREEVHRMLAEARRTADSPERILILSRAMELAAKAEVLERQLRGDHPVPVPPETPKDEDAP